MAEVNHAIWRMKAWDTHDGIAEGLVPALDHMLASLKRVRAGETQTRYSETWPALVGELAAEGKQIIGDHDPRLTRVSEAQAAAGGEREVYGDKRASRI